MATIKVGRVEFTETRWQYGRIGSGSFGGVDIHIRQHADDAPEISWQSAGGESIRATREFAQALMDATDLATMWSRETFRAAEPGETQIAKYRKEDGSNV